MKIVHVYSTIIIINQSSLIYYTVNYNRPNDFILDMFYIIYMNYIPHLLQFIKATCTSP